MLFIVLMKRVKLIGVKKKKDGMDNVKPIDPKCRFRFKC